LKSQPGSTAAHGFPDFTARSISFILDVWEALNNLVILRHTNVTIMSSFSQKKKTNKYHCNLIELRFICLRIGHTNSEFEERVQERGANLTRAVVQLRDLSGTSQYSERKSHVFDKNGLHLQFIPVDGNEIRFHIVHSASL
jgi:hypothetical protein